MYAVSPGVRSTSNQDGGLVLDIEGGKIYRLNPVGTLILQGINMGQGEIDIAEDLACQHQVKRDQALADVREFIEVLKRRGLVQWRLESTEADP